MSESVVSSLRRILYTEERSRGCGGKEAEERGAEDVEGRRQRQEEQRVWREDGGKVLRTVSLKVGTESDVLNRPADIDTFSHFLLFLSLEKL